MTDHAQGPSGEPDGEALLAEARERYRREREARIRADANEQFVETVDRYAGFTADPWAGEPAPRPAVDETVEVVVVGGGFGGLLAGAMLREAGVDELRIIEKGADFGGVWYWNRYPGVQCDVESYIYMPLLEELGYLPSEKYASGREIFAHCRAIGEKYGLYGRAYFQTEVDLVEWDETTALWSVRTTRGDLIRARFVVMSPGNQHRPRLPGIPGIETFQGRAFHTSRWDYSYTGGDQHGGLTGLEGRRVGIIGTGATALQVVPKVAEYAQHLYVFQRTPSVVWERGNRATDPAWARSLEPGWQRRRMRNFLTIVSGHAADEDLVDDGWTRSLRSLSQGEPARAETGSPSPQEREQRAELADLALMERIRARVDDVVKDPRVAESLKPYFRFMCKRPGFHDQYLPTFNRPNVSLVDTAGRGVERVTPGGVVAAGQEYALDCLIFATGFDVGRGYLRTAGYEVVGRGARRLSEYWSDGPRTLHGFHSRGFPNCLLMGNTQTGITVNFVNSLLEQARHVAYLISTYRERGYRVVEVSAEAQEKWVKIFDDQRPSFVKFQRDCTPSYFNSEGDPADPNGVLANRYPEGAVAFFDLLEAWRSTGALDGLEVSP